MSPEALFDEGRLLNIEYLGLNVLPFLPFGKLYKQVLFDSFELVDGLGSLSCELLQNGSGPLFLSFCRPLCEPLVELMCLPASHAVGIIPKIHPVDDDPMLLPQVSFHALPDDGSSLILDLLDQFFLDIENPPDEPYVHVLSLSELLSHCAYLYRLAVLVSLNAMIALISTAMEGSMVAF